MMGVYIKGMEMPKVPTRFIIFADGRVEDEDDSAYKYSAVPVPPHGDLIERDAAIRYLSVILDPVVAPKAYGVIAGMSTIIPAEPTKEGT